jgi:hypothetical protein
VEQSNPKNLLRNNLTFVVSCAIVLASMLIAISFSSYLSSPTRALVDILQANKQTSSAKQTVEQFKSSGPVTKDELKGLIETTKASVGSFSDDVDYNPEALNDESLGL